MEQEMIVEGAWSLFKITFLLIASFLSGFIIYRDSGNIIISLFYSIVFIICAIIMSPLNPLDDMD